MKIFLLEDDFILHKAIKNTLLLENYEVESFYDGLVGLNSIGNLYDLYIVDINLPNISGLEITQKIRTLKPTTKIFIISANSDIETIKIGYDNGCDDFLKKPFDVEELLLKTAKLTSSNTMRNIYLSFNVYYNQNLKKLFIDDNEVLLTKNETLFIDLLSENLNHGVSYETLINGIYGLENKDINSLRSLVKRLRKKLPDNTIKTNLFGKYAFYHYI